MIICKFSCPAFNSCKEREPHQRCTYDLGIFNGVEDMDDEDPIERLMY